MSGDVQGVWRGSIAIAIAIGVLACSSGRRVESDREGSHPGPTTMDGGAQVPQLASPDATVGSDCSGGLGSVDDDSDGFTEDAGDCNDCSPQINPGAYDFPGNGFDEDCSGSDAATGEVECDVTLPLDSTDATDGARAIGLCKFTTEHDAAWGVIQAAYVTADGSAPMPNPRQAGILPDFGAAAPRQGGSFLALSSGAARAPDQSGFTDSCDEYGGRAFPSPPGFPRESPACPGVRSGAVWDPAALEVRVRVPTNANSFTFNSNFYTYEYPYFICSEYNDFFVTLMQPAPSGLADDNVLFDQDGNLVSVNSSLFQVCEPGYWFGRDFSCPQGRALLAGTSFDMDGSCDLTGAESGGATGWLTTTAPVVPGSIVTLRFAIWDSGDMDLDSLALIDNFQWSVEEPERVETVPVY